MAGSASADFGRLVRQVLAWLLILAFSTALLAAVILPRLGGGVPYVIETGSMRPGMPPGTLVVVRPVDPARIAVGSVITYQLRSGEPAVVTHRVVGQGVDTSGEQRFRTQGDANNAADQGWVRPEQVRGERWYAVPLLGYATTVITGAQRHVLLLGMVSLLLGYAVVMVATDLRERRRTPREVTS